jgi:long-chain acyl-CoA synthetase
MSLNLYDQLHQSALRWPDHAAVVGPLASDAISYRALAEAVCAVSGELRAAGVQAGDCVGLHCPSSAQYIIYTYAVWRCGGCVIPLPMELAADEKQGICRCLAMDYVLSRRRESAFLDPFREGEPHKVAGDATLVQMRNLRERPVGMGAINAAFIRFSSGTTGAAKGVVLSHETIDERIRAANDALEIGPADRVLWVLSMSYHFTVSVVAYLAFGATIVLPENHFAAAMVDAIRRYEVSLLYASPTHYGLLADYPRAAPLPSLRLALSTTSSLDGRVAERFEQRYGRAVGQALGIIEIGLPCINVDGDSRRSASVGRVLPAYRLRLERVGPEEDVRETAFRGPGFLDAYYHPWQTRREILADGWFRTGDLGRLDGDGYLYLSGRTKDVINVMGMKFFPQEVESVLTSHPEVADASVFAGRDEKFGEIVRACVVARRSAPELELANQLRQYCRERVASYKVPERIEFVASLPRTASGKVLRRAI